MRKSFCKITRLDVLDSYYIIYVYSLGHFRVLSCLAARLSKQKIVQRLDQLEKVSVLTLFGS